MPKEPINYSKSIIYKIYCNDSSITEIYIGSTTNFKLRKCQHKSACYNDKSKKINMKIYKFINDNGGWDNFSMIPIIEYPCENKIQLLIKEEEYRKELNSNLNSCNSYSGIEYKNNKEYMREYSKKYRENKKLN